MRKSSHFAMFMPHRSTTIAEHIDLMIAYAKREDFQNGISYNEENGVIVMVMDNNRDEDTTTPFGGLEVAIKQLGGEMRRKQEPPNYDWWIGILPEPSKSRALQLLSKWGEWNEDK